MSIARCAGLAARQNCSMLFLPECFGYMGEQAGDSVENAELLQPSEIDPSIARDLETEFSKWAHSADINEFKHDPVFERSEASCSLYDGLIFIAQKSNLWLSAGGMHVAGAPDNQEGKNRIYNTHIILDDTGSIKACYRKVHLFDVSIPDKTHFKESATTAPGSQLVVCPSPIGAF